MRSSVGELHPSRAVARRMHELESELQLARTHLRRHSKSPDTTGRWGLEQPAEPQQEEGWFLTYLDMMTLLLVVMIVMLAFSGHLSGQDGATSTAPAPAPEVQPAATTNSPSTPVPVVAIDTNPGSDGLLPGRTGLLHGDASGLHTELAAATESAVAFDIPSTDQQPPLHPADIGPLPRNVTALIGINSARSRNFNNAELVAGWSAADLVASFIGPPRPDQGIADDLFASSAALDQAPADEPGETMEGPSEGEILAADLALGNLGSDVEIVVNERSVSFRVNSEILFDSSQADLSRTGLGVLRNIVSVLTKAGYDVTVEGHTDAVPVRRNARYPSNWELSSARAGSVVRYLQANGIDRARLKAVGYADTRPLADNHTPEGRAKNRRVELMIEKPGQPGQPR